MPSNLLNPGDSSGAKILSAGINAAVTGFQNRRERKYAEKMMNKQRQWALEDYHMQNSYNSPAAQMQRLKDAKLSPNLVYGNGASMKDAAPIRSADINKPSVQQWEPPAPSGMFGYMDTELKRVQYDNAIKVGDKLAADKLLTEASTIKTLADSETSKFDLSLKSQLRENSVQVAETLLKKAQADVQFTLDQNDRAAAQSKATLLESAEAILKSRAERSKLSVEKSQILQQIENLKKDGRLKQLDINLKEKGIQPGDPIYMRILSQVISGISNNKKTDSFDVNGLSVPKKSLPWPLSSF